MNRKRKPHPLSLPLSSLEREEERAGHSERNMNEPKHMPLPVWDKDLAPLLGAIRGRAKWLVVDAHQIRDWVNQLAAVPVFETMAMEKMIEARDALQEALSSVDEAVDRYKQKEKVT